MARTTSKTVSTPVAPVATPTIVDEVVVDDSAHKTKKPKKAKVVAEPEPVVVEAPVVEIANEVVVAEEPALDATDATDAVAPAADVPFNSTLVKMTEFGKRINDLTAILSSLKLEYKTLEKGIGKDIKIAQKHFSKGKRNGAKRAPTGFVKPTLISDELAKFLDKEPGTEMGRTAASKEVHNYIKANQLNKGRTIHPDVVLAKILNYTEGVSPVLTYLNLQTYLKHHFIGNKVVAPVAEATTVSV